MGNYWVSGNTMTWTGNTTGSYTTVMPVAVAAAAPVKETKRSVLDWLDDRVNEMQNVAREAMAA